MWLGSASLVVMMMKLKEVCQCQHQHVQQKGPAGKCDLKGISRRVEVVCSCHFQKVAQPRPRPAEDADADAEADGQMSWHGLGLARSADMKHDVGQTLIFVHRYEIIQPHQLLAALPNQPISTKNSKTLPPLVVSIRLISRTCFFFNLPSFFMASRNTASLMARYAFGCT